MIGPWPDVLPYRCGAVCTHGSAGGCQHPEVAGRGAPVPIGQARAPGGACGPEAERMGFSEPAR